MELKVGTLVKAFKSDGYFAYEVVTKIDSNEVWLSNNRQVGAKYLDYNIVRVEPVVYNKVYGDSVVARYTQFINSKYQSYEFYRCMVGWIIRDYVREPYL